MLELYKYLKPYISYIIIILILIFLQVLTDLYLPTLMSDIVDNGIVNMDINYIIKIGGFMLMIAALGVLCAVFANFLASKISIGLGKMLRDKVFTKVESFSLQEFNKIGTSSLITRTTNDINQIQQVTIIIFSIMLRAPLTCIGGIYMAFKKERALTWTFLIVVPIIAAVITIILNKSIPLFKLMQVKLDKLNLVLREKLTGIRVIRAFNRDEYEKVRFDNANIDLANNAIKVNKIMAVLRPIMMLIINFTTIAIIWFGAIRIDNGTMQVGSLMAFIQYAMQILFSVLMLSMMFIMIPRAQASAVRVNEILNMVPEITDPKETKKINNKKASIEFKNVTFSFPRAEQSVLSNISFSSNIGETTAIIGSTGSGKSALINLILRFYDIQSGSILINGVDIKEISQKDLRSKIGFVPQKTVLFTGTIADNIRYGKRDASDEEVKHAAKVAQAEDFIHSKEEGFDYVITQGGTNISGGQKQRLAIARALVRKPDIYIFDDSFSALDFKTDAKLRNALKSEIKDSTVIVVAQRVSTVMDADRIIVLDEGKIVGMGTHNELLNCCEVYREIVSSQLSKEELS